jgi:flavin-dependent dehydrogenase
LALALQLKRRRPATKVTVLERHGFPVPEAAFKVGEATAESGSHYLSEVLGLRDHLRRAQLTKMGLRFFPQGCLRAPFTARAEIGLRRFFPAKTYLIDRGRLENELAERTLEAGCELLSGHRVLDVEIDPVGAHRVCTEATDGARDVLDARWIVDASGRRALLKRKLGLTAPVAHDVYAVWARVTGTVKVDSFCDQDPGSVGVAAAC